MLENAGITLWQRLANALGFLTRSKVQKEALPAIRMLAIKTPSLDRIIGNLSGGNHQKVSVAKWLAAGVAVLIVDEPSIGIDIKTKACLHQLLRDVIGPPNAYRDQNNGILASETNRLSRSLPAFIAASRQRQNVASWDRAA